MMGQYSSGKKFLSTTALTLGLMMSGPALAMDDFTTPTGEQVVGGAATFDRPSAGTLNINQSTDRVVINWDSFDIGTKGKTEFFQPGTGSLAVNRVTGADSNPTQILGTLKSNGRVMVLDRNGILFGANAVLDVGGIVASTGDVDNNAVMRGDTVLTLSNFGDGSVVNDGTIRVANAGLAAFVAPQVANNGIIEARMGKVALAAGGESATVDLYGDGLVELAVGGSAGKALASNAGTINAEGGNVLMTTAATKGVVDNVVNMSGVVNVASVTQKGGKIILSAAGGTVKVSGTMDATGATGGGSIKVGGDYQGGGDIAWADTVDVTDTAVLKADATDNGNGGDIIVWSQTATTSRGRYYARGGANGGNGGLVETSSVSMLDVTETVVDTRAALGSAGTWLIDPATITVDSILAATISGALSNVSLLATDSITFAADINILAAGVSLTATAGAAGINAANNYLRTNGGDVTFSTTGAIGLNKYTIYTKSGDVSLTGDTVSINNNAAISTQGGSVLVKSTSTANGTTTLSINNSRIDATGGLNAGGIHLRRESGALFADANAADSATDAQKATFTGNPQTEFDSSQNGGVVTLQAKKISTNSSCINAGGALACGIVSDPIVATDIYVTADDLFKIYGATDPLLTYTHTSGTLLAGDVFIGNVERVAGETAGDYTINLGTLAISGAGSYNIVFTAGTFTIQKADLTIAANSDSKIYGTAYNFTGAEYSITSGSLVTGDSISSVNLSSSGAAANAGIGAYGIAASGATGSGLGNYNITYAGGLLTVDKAALTLTAKNQTKTYGDTFTFNGNEYSVTSGALVSANGDSITSVNLASAGAANTAIVAGGPYAITVSGATGSGLLNYDITYVAGDLTINKATLTVDANDATKTYDGLAFNGGNGVTYAGFVNGDDQSDLGGTLAYGGSAQGAINAGTYTITASGYTSGNYNIGYTDGDLTVNKATLTATADNQSMTYGGAFPTLTATYGGFVGSDGVGDIDTLATLASGTAANANVGFYNDTLTASGALDNNYSFSYVAGDLTIDKATLTVDANDATKTYDGLAFNGGNGVTYTGFVGSEDETALGGTLSYGGSAQGAVNTGAYTITASGLTSGNYAISYTDGTLTVDKAQLTATVNDDSKAYDGQVYSGGNGVIYAGFVNGETDSVLDQSGLTYGGRSQGAVNAGTYSITASGVAAQNYDIAAYNPGTLVVDQVALVIDASDATKTYDGLSFSGGNGVTYTGFVNSETEAVLGGLLSYAGSAQGAVNAGTYTITASGLTSGNYAISYTDGTLTVDKAQLTATVNNDLKFYDSLAYSGGNGVTYTGFVNGENDSVVDQSGLVYAGTSQGAVNAGLYGIRASGATAQNYDITTYNTGLLLVRKAFLIGLVNGDSKTYDGLAYSGGNGVTYLGFVGGENASVLDQSGLVYSGTSQGAVNAGFYGIRASGATAQNYNILAYVPGLLNIGRAAVTVTANSFNKTYGVDYIFSGAEFSESGLVNGETLGSVALSSLGAAATAGVAGNPYDITISGGTGGTANLANYNVTYVNGALTVDKAQLTATVSNDLKLYDSLAYSGGNGVTYTGFVNGENDSVVDQSGLVYGGSSQGAVNAGIYDITASGATAQNYDIIAYNPGTLRVNKAFLIGLVNGDSKTYDGLAYSGGNGVTYFGFVGGEDASVLDQSGLVYGGTSQGAVNAGLYGIRASGANAQNYNILAYVPGLLTINQARIEVTADPKSKVFGTTDPALTYHISAGQLFGKDSFTGGLVRDTGEAVGLYAINQGTLALNANYALSYVGADFEITPAQVALEDFYRTFEGFTGPDSSFSVTITGMPSATGAGGNVPAIGGFDLASNLANIAPAAGGENGNSVEGDLADIEPAAGGQAPAQASCWAQAVDQATTGAVVSYSFGSSREEALDQTASCATETEL